MSDELKLNDVVERGRLDLTTARYVLRNPEALPGMPDAGSQGKHRRFSIPQAVRLASCAHLVMAGVPLATAGDVVLEGEKEARTLMKLGRTTELLFSEPLPKDHWILRGLDSRYFQVWQKGQRSRRYSTMHFWNAETGHWELYTEDALLVRYELDLTALELQLRHGGK